MDQTKESLSIFVTPDSMNFIRSFKNPSFCRWEKFVRSLNVALEALHFEKRGLRDFGCIV